jgi:hypothetical protein
MHKFICKTTSGMGGRSGFPPNRLTALDFEEKKLNFASIYDKTLTVSLKLFCSLPFADEQRRWRRSESSENKLRNFTASADFFFRSLSRVFQR